jgi:MFS transporter, DHA2 family, multidrug resistance protein
MSHAAPHPAAPAAVAHGTDETSLVPERAGLVLGALIAVAAVANLGLAVANVALPSIGKEFDASQTALNLVAVGYSLGLAASVLYFGAVGDRYGRKLLLILGMVVTVPADCLAAWAPSIEVLFGARVLGGLAAGMAYPTTLALITALWSGPARTKSIALWAATGGAISALGPLGSGILLEHFWWGSVFLLTLPLAVIALAAAVLLVPSHVNEATDPVDHLGGVLSVALVGALILGINFAAVPNETALIVGLFIVAAAALIAFYIRQRRAENPLYDLHSAARPTFWVAACAGLIVFGSLMGAMFIGQQFLQNVLGYSTVDAGLAILPAAAFMVVVAPRSAKLVEARGARFTLLFGYVFVLLGFLTMLLLWKDNIPYWKVALGYSFVGIGVGLAGTPASHSLTGSVPVRRVGMASGTADLQRDLGGAIMQSIFGALLTAGYATAAGVAVSASGKNITQSVQAELTKSFASAADTAQRYPPSVQDNIIAGAKTAFLQGDQWAYLAGIVAVLLGATLVFLMFPKREQERQLLQSYQTHDQAQSVPSSHVSRDAADPASQSDRAANVALPEQASIRADRRRRHSSPPLP